VLVCIGPCVRVNGEIEGRVAQWHQLLRELARDDIVIPRYIHGIATWIEIERIINKDIPGSPAQPLPHW